MKQYLGCFLTIILLPLASMANALENVGVKTLEQAFAVTSVLTDSDALTFGIADFDLQYLVDDPGFGNEETLDFKKSIDLFVVPYSWQLQDIEEDWSHAISIRGFYVEVARDSEPLQGFTNFEKEQVFGAFIQYSQHYQLSDNWYSGFALGGHVMHYRNQYNYSPGFPEHIADALDGHIFNTSATVLMAEPVLKFGYQKQQSWGQWTLHNSNHYLIGQGIGGSARNISEVTPEGWRVTNGLEFKFNVPNMWGISDHIALDLKRVDIGGDMSPLANNDYYYETSIGWVIDTSNKIPLLDNVGIGLNINYGSSVSGGTIVFYYNE